MNLRWAAVIALVAYLAAQWVPAIDDHPGYELLAMAFHTAAMYVTPEALDLFVTGGTSLDRYITILAFSGSSANVCFVAAVVFGCLRSAGWTLVAALAAALNAASGLIAIVLEAGPFMPKIGCWLWIGSMIGLGSAAGWTLWRERTGAEHKPPG